MKVAVGIGCDRGTSLATLEAALSQALAEAGLSSEAIVLLASITLKADEPGLLALAARLPCEIRFYSPEELAAVPVPHPSEVVRRHTGTPSVAEAAALLAAGVGMEALIVEKHRYRGLDGRNATVSIARMS